MTFIERRRYPRIPGHFSVDLLNMGDDPEISLWEAVVPATALDVSLEGLRLKSFYNARVGSFLSVVIYYKNKDSVCLCEVIWKRQEGRHYIYGLFIKEWSKLDLEFRSLIMDTVPPGYDPITNSDPTEDSSQKQKSPTR